MSWPGKIYKENQNGIIITLFFHIILFVILNASQFKKKQEYKETEMIIDFPEEILEQIPPQIKDQQLKNTTNSDSRTNFASNKALKNQSSPFDEEYQQELERAQKLVQDISSQLKKDIPTIDNLKMPEDVNEELDPDSVLNKVYSGDSNIEYFLKERYHIRLPIPVYLAQTGGIVRVNITVNNKGRVLKAEPIIDPYHTEQLLSYAKTAALRTRFNRITAKKNQHGYIIYTFEAQ